MKWKASAAGVTLVLLIGSWLGVGSAQASEFIISDTNNGNSHGHAIVHGESPEGWSISHPEMGYEAWCGGVTATGTAVTGTDTTISVEPEFESCTDSFARTYHTSVNGCLLVFHPGSGMDISCPAGKSITTTTTSAGQVVCTTSIGTQEGIEGVTYSNTTASSVTVEFEVLNMKFTSTGGGLFACWHVPGEHSYGTIIGYLVLTAFNTEASPMDIKVN
jgi:hypothetical protein